MGLFNIFSQSPDVSFEKSIYDFTVKDIYGEDFKFEKLKGKKNNDRQHCIKVRLNSTI